MPTKRAGEAALKIRAQLPKAKVLRIEGKPTGWDIADAVAESMDVEAFIKDCPTEIESDTATPGQRCGLTKACDPPCPGYSHPLG